MTLYCASGFERFRLSFAVGIRVWIMSRIKADCLVSQREIDSVAGSRGRGTNGREQAMADDGGYDPCVCLFVVKYCLTSAGPGTVS